MPTIQVILDEILPRATERATRSAGLNRSALIRNALRDHLMRLEIRELERRDRQGYESVPQQESDLVAWERACCW